MDEISIRVTPLARVTALAHQCGTAHDISGSPRSTPRQTSSILKQQHGVHKPHNKQGQHVTAPCKSISSFQQGIWRSTRLSKALSSQQFSYSAHKGQLPNSVCLCPSLLDPSSTIPHIGCCRNKYIGITLGITALRMSCALTEKLQKSHWHTRYYGSPVVKTACSCYGSMLVNFEGVSGRDWFHLSYIALQEMYFGEFCRGWRHY